MPNVIVDSRLNVGLSKRSHYVAVALLDHMRVDVHAKDDIGSTALALAS